jgi:hypothetical protein
MDGFEIILGRIHSLNLSMEDKPNHAKRFLIKTSFTVATISLLCLPSSTLPRLVDWWPSNFLSAKFQFLVYITGSLPHPIEAFTGFSVSQ